MTKRPAGGPVFIPIQIHVYSPRGREGRGAHPSPGTWAAIADAAPMFVVSTSRHFHSSFDTRQRVDQLLSKTWDVGTMGFIHA